MTVGNFGSDDRMDYTMIGGTVNLASRLEHEAPPGGALISFETYALVKDHVRCEECGQVQVKGIAQPVTTYACERSDRITILFLLRCMSPLLALSGHELLHCTCLLLTQSGHEPPLQGINLSRYDSSFPLAIAVDSVRASRVTQ